ncbi:MAG TPA: Jag N-terminal domain-containing protein, partial [Acidimicrobiales bacterium]|nr:Jag N-terminal domain-containing protein [Acidimicrobiales bacterium]
MEWVETTGRTVEEALDAALDQLGVDATDADYEVIEEPRVGLFGRLRTEARVRARVRPSTPRPKEERRGRGRKASAGGPPERRPTNGDAAPTELQAAAPATTAGRGARAGEGDPTVPDVMDGDVPLREQGEVAAEFLEGLLERFGAPQATVTVHEIEV